MKIMVCGHGRHGKDQFCEFLGLPFTSSSMIALETVIWPEMWNLYETKEHCFEDRVNKREQWAEMIRAYNTPDLTKLARDIFAECDVYCGIRSRDEFLKAKEEGLFDLAIWVDASERVPEVDPTCEVLMSDCNIIIYNNGTLEEIKEKAIVIREAITAKSTAGQSTKDMIVNWANEVFPDRTVTNAIQKLALEELPEFLMAQDDPMELADVAIIVEDIAYLKGWDLDAIKREKMAININRKWAIDDTTGLMNHVE